MHLGSKSSGVGVWLLLSNYDHDGHIPGAQALPTEVRKNILENLDLPSLYSATRAYLSLSKTFNAFPADIIEAATSRYRRQVQQCIRMVAALSSNWIAGMSYKRFKFCYLNGPAKNVSFYGRFGSRSPRCSKASMVGSLDRSTLSRRYDSESDNTPWQIPRHSQTPGISIVGRRATYITRCLATASLYDA